MSRRTSVLVCCFAAGLCFGCDPGEPGAHDSQPDPVHGGKADAASSSNEAWAEYVETVRETAALQAGCEPVHASVPAGVERRGAVVLFHGFTACPQQFFDLLEPLTEAGYEVFLPVLPGHGRVPEVEDGKYVDDISGLPGVGELHVYDELVQDMEAVVAAVPGEHVVGGLSVGGAVALSALVDDEEAVWDRGLALAPFFAFAGPLRLLNVGPSWLRMGWGAGCLDERTRDEPRAGICEFELGHLRAVRDLGQRVRSELGGIEVPLVIVGVEEDPVANPSSIADAVRKAPVADLCFMPRDVSHSMLSPYDAPDEDKYWLDSTVRQTTAALVDGTAFSTGVPSKYEPFPRCSLG